MFSIAKVSLFSCGHPALIVSFEALSQIARAASVEPNGITFALQKANVNEIGHLGGRPSRSSRRSLCKPDNVRLRLGFGATVFVRYFVAGEDWRRGELNPCPR